MNECAAQQWIGAGEVRAGEEPRSSQLNPVLGGADAREGVTMMGQSLAALVAVAAFAVPALGQPSTHDIVVSGMKCRQNSMGSLECDYRVGRTLHVNIAGVGDKDASIIFMASSFKGDFYASVGVLHGCVIVKPGETNKDQGILDVAFISPRSGKVYNDWESCQQGK